MTENNHRFQQSHSSLNLNYTKLAIAELSFLNVLFERMDPSDLGAINYPTFKLRVLQTCPRELEALLED